MALYLSPATFKDRPRLDVSHIGWGDTQGEAVQKRMKDAYTSYITEFEKGKQFADAYEKYMRSVNEALSKDEPQLHSL